MKAKNQRADRRSSARPSRRSFLKTGAAFTLALPFLQGVREGGGRRLQNVEDAGTLEQQWRQNPGPNHYLLLRGGTVVSMDPKVGDFVKGDVLIQGKKIVSVAAELKAPPQAEVIDARNTIVIPGFVDAHRHSWEGPASAHHSQRRYYRIHGYDASGFCSLLPAA